MIPKNVVKNRAVISFDNLTFTQKNLNHFVLDTFKLKIKQKLFICLGSAY